jgi:8-oxo-dGTP pyrophosphatase MutT (NUDIX family)
MREFSPFQWNWDGAPAFCFGVFFRDPASVALKNALVSADRGGEGPCMTSEAEADEKFAPDKVFSRAAQCLSLAPRPADGGRPKHGDHALNPLSPPLFGPARPAAVLVPLIAYPDEIKVLLTLRASALRNHSGQIAFPGGKIEAEDASPVAAALRESHEEVGLSADEITPIGYLDPYLTGTGFRVIPVVARIAPSYQLRINPDEVDEAFEVPFSFLMTEANHELHAREWRGMMRSYYAMLYGERNIWGATAGIIRNLYETLYG